jgi:hypothetical protein
MDSNHPYLLRAAIRERKALADRIATAVVIGFACGCAASLLAYLAVVELAR